jgi:hypothetical protein
MLPGRAAEDAGLFLTIFQGVGGMDYAINSFDQAGNPYTRWNAREGHFCRAAEMPEAEPSIGGEDRVTISHAARRMREEADKESEVTMIGSIHSNLMGMGTARTAATAKAGAAAEAFSQYLSESALPEDDQAGEEAVQEQASTANESIASEADESAPPDEKILTAAPLSGRRLPLLGRQPMVIIPFGGAASIGPASDEYFALLKQCHDEVVAERNIDLGKYEADPALKDSPEGRAATQAIYEKLAAIPRAQELGQILGLTAVTDLGEPYNPNLENLLSRLEEERERRRQDGSLNSIAESGNIGGSKRIDIQQYLYDATAINKIAFDFSKLQPRRVISAAPPK